MRPILKMVFTLFRVGNKTMKIPVSCHDEFKCTLLCYVGKRSVLHYRWLHSVNVSTFLTLLTVNILSHYWVESALIKSLKIFRFYYSLFRKADYIVLERKRGRENRWTIKRNIQANLQQFSGMFFQPRKSRLNSYKIKWNETFAFDSLYVLCWMCFGSSGAAHRTCECV